MEERDAQLKQERAKLVQHGISSSMQVAQCHAADMAIGNFFYANGLSFAAATSEPDSFYREMVAAIKATPCTYIPPARGKLSGPLLEACYSRMNEQMAKRDADGAFKEKFGATYVSDGWDSVDHVPLVNSAFVCANDGGMYWRSVDTSGFEKGAEYLASLMIADIYEYGCTNVIMVTTDTCSTMKKARWQIVEDEFPWI